MVYFVVIFSCKKPEMSTRKQGLQTTPVKQM